MLTVPENTGYSENVGGASAGENIKNPAESVRGYPRGWTCTLAARVFVWSGRLSRNKCLASLTMRVKGIREVLWIYPHVLRFVPIPNLYLEEVPGLEEWDGGFVVENLKYHFPTECFWYDIASITVSHAEFSKVATSMLVAGWQPEGIGDQDRNCKEPSEVVCRRLSSEIDACCRAVGIREFGLF